MKKIFTLTFIFLIFGIAQAFATCSNPLNILNSTSTTVPMSVTQGADGNCQSNVAPNVWYPGTSNNGLLTSALTLESTELNSLTNGSVAVSTVGGSSGIFTNSNTGQAVRAEIFAALGTAGATCAAGANLAGWFLQSSDGGTTFEPTGSAPARSPDFVIPLPATTLNATFKAPGPVVVPALKFKVLIQNNCGASGTLAASANTISLVPEALQN